MVVQYKINLAKGFEILDILAELKTSDEETKYDSKWISLYYF
jgi:hypothetical protein